MVYSKQTCVHLIKWLLVQTTILLFTPTASPLSVHPTSTYSVINMEDEFLQNPEAFNKHEIPEVSRRGYAGDDFYQKASKSIPRLGRRSSAETSGCICKPLTELEGEILGNEDTIDNINLQPSAAEGEVTNKRKRLNLVSKDVSAWPWFTDRVPNTIFKRTELNEKCFYVPTLRNFLLNYEICNDDLICCPINTDLPILKRVVPTYSNKQITTSVPDYKSNRFM